MLRHGYIGCLQMSKIYSHCMVVLDLKGFCELSLPKFGPFSVTTAIPRLLDLCGKLDRHHGLHLGLDLQISCRL